MSSRRDALYEYFSEVVRDLLMRGVIRRKQGQSLDMLLRAEAETVLREVANDLSNVATDLGFGLLNGVGTFIGGVMAGLRPKR